MSASSGRAAPPRGLGLGLGHQVVRRIAAVHAGRFEALEAGDAGQQAYRVVLEATTADDTVSDTRAPT